MEPESLDALSQAFPGHWVLYASFRCLLRRAPSIQVDALVAMEYRVLLLELRSLRDEPSANGDRWVFPNGIQKPSPVYEASEKAVKLKGLLQEVVQGWSGTILVDGMVVLTGQARGAALPTEQRERGDQPGASMQPCGPCGAQGSPDAVAAPVAQAVRHEGRAGQGI